MGYHPSVGGATVVIAVGDGVAAFQGCVLHPWLTSAAPVGAECAYPFLHCAAILAASGTELTIQVEKGWHNAVHLLFAPFQLCAFASKSFH
jgi:hypothetical protein